MAREVTLNVRAIAAMRRFNRELTGTFATPALVESFLDATCGELVICIRQAVATQPLRCEVVEFPRDWWQAFRQRWFPRWALVRWPVRLCRVELRADAVYPEIPIVEGRGPRIVVIDRTEREFSWAPPEVSP